MLIFYEQISRNLLTKQLAGVIIRMRYNENGGEVLKKLKTFSRIFVLFLTLSLISSCKSIESEVTAAKTATTTSTAAELLLDGGSPGGIALGTDAVTAVSALPFPDTADAVSNDTASAVSNETSVTDETTEELTSSEAETTTKAAETTTRAAETTTATTTSTSTTTTTTAATTTAVTTAELTTVTKAETTPAAAENPNSYRKNSYKAVNHTRVKAVWISYIELSNHLYGKDETAFRKEFAAMLDNCAGFGINTLYVHVRAFGDAYYYSSLFPFTKNMTGTVGKRTSYDPLKIMLSEAHSRGMSFHAWINPLRLGSGTDVAAVSSDYPVGKWYAGTEKGKYIVNVNGTWYLNPAYSAVRQLIGDNVREIVSLYDVDGIHIDDYFYPTIDASFDSAAFAGSGYQTLSAFRIANCSAMVKEMYTAAHECGSAIFGAAPQGNNINNLNQLYADTKAWCAGGYIDYFTPQIYYGFENSGVSFAACVDEWAGIVKGRNTKLYAGLSVYKAGAEDKWAGAGKYEWQNTNTMLKRQTEYAEANGCGGIALYSYSYLFDSGYMNSATKVEADNLKPLLKNQ